MTKFLRIELRGEGNLVAVFDAGYRSVWFTGTGCHPDDGTFCRNRPSLETAIVNLERRGADASEERRALVELIARGQS